MTRSSPNNYLEDKTKAQRDLASWRAFVERQIRGTQPKQRKSHGSLWDLQKGRCWICGLPMTRQNVSRDHLHPKSRGGKNVANNILLAHKACNSRRRNEGIYTRAEALAMLAAKVKALANDKAAT